MNLRIISFPKLCSILLLFANSANADSAPDYQVYNVRDFGAVANGDQDDVEAFIIAWNEACYYSYGGKVLVPEGKYLVSFATLQGPCKGPTVFEINGVVKALGGLSMEVDCESWITFQYINNLTLKGTGVFHGQGATAWPLDTCSTKCKCKRPISLRFNFLNDSAIQGGQSVDSKMFHINILGCNNLKLESLSISAPKDSPNTDGIHIGYSQNIEISSSTIGTGDDCVSLGQGSKNINIFDISCGPGHGISVGSLGNFPDEKEVVIGLSVRNCTLNETHNGVRIKTWPGNTTDGFVSNIIFDDIFMNNVGNPIIIDQKYCPYYKCSPELASHIKICNLSYTNIHGTSASKVAVSLICSSDFPCQNVNIGDINLVYNGTDGPAISFCSNIQPFFTGQQTPPICI